MRRHDLAYLRPGSPFRFLCGEAAPELVVSVSAWIGQGLPLVVSRQSHQTAELQLALTLPTLLGRQRLACVFKREDVFLISPPLEVGKCLALLEAGAGSVLASLEAEILSSGASLGVFGSLAWEALTGEIYRHAESDIDLICDVRSLGQLDHCLDVLTTAAAALKVRLDGELRFPGGDAVSWRELAGCRHKPEATLLIKGTVDVSLKPLSALLETLIPESVHA